MHASMCEVLPRECVKHNQRNSFDVWICETAGLIARISFVRSKVRKRVKTYCYSNDLSFLLASMLSVYGPTFVSSDIILSRADILEYAVRLIGHSLDRILQT